MNEAYKSIMMIFSIIFGASFGYNFGKIWKINDVINSCDLSEKELFAAKTNKRKRIVYIIASGLAYVAVIVFIGGLIK